MLLASLFVPVLATQHGLVVAASGYVSVTVNPGQVTFAAGSLATTQITMASTGGFAGTLSLAGYSLPYLALNVTLNPSSVTLTAGGPATSTERFRVTARQLPTPTRLR